jgi:hypothetical protein
MMTYVCEQVCVVFHIIASPCPVVIARPYISGNKQVEMTEAAVPEVERDNLRSFFHVAE